MFSKSKKNAASTTATPHTVPSIISADLKIVGDLESAGEVQVDGEVSGDIRAKVLLVGESAKIKGEILADTVRVHGHVNGQIKAKFVNLAKSAHVIGDILHENLSIQEGAFLEGHITHMSETDTATKPKAAEAPSSEGRPAEDRVNLVVKAGQKPTAAPQQAGAAPQANATKTGTGN